ncbi:threonyl-tRNA synthetase [Coemansia sp. RSA 1285]|nr:threonyl-tRNA synthetase [Coemansia sp. RSA 1285]
MSELAAQAAKLSVNDTAPKPSGKPKKAKEGGSGTSAASLTEPPAYIEHRNRIFDKLYKQQQEDIARKPREKIVITLPDGSEREGLSWETTPMDIASAISKSLAKRLVIAKVNGVLWDTVRPFESSASLELLDFEHSEGKKVYWHSSAHVLGEACELHFGCNLCNGPPIDPGFYYDIALPDDFGRGVSQDDFAPLEKLANKAIKEKQPFERLMLSKEDLMRMFSYNKYKVYLINDRVPDGTSTTVYRCGPLIDLCRGPHVPHTGNITAFAVMKNSASYFLGNSNADSLQRVYGISFPDKKQLVEHKKFIEEASKRDHRKLGEQHDLFFLNKQFSPGSASFLPHGTRVYNKLVDFMRGHYRERGFDEVISPNMFNVELWKQSGHWDNYKDDMFVLDVDKAEFALKPMNCPGHCIMFGFRDRSYRELPIRFADFGVLHRNEASGALCGLTRVRRFQQDDAHIFCRPDQVKSEIRSAFQFLHDVYSVFGFTYSLVLSTRPEKFLGEIAVWDKAEKALAEALDEFGAKWELNPQDGAFYGPKIDITIRDALNRPWQCATIQLDFQLPVRFNLQYRAPNTGAKDDGSGNADTSEYQRPVIIHRTILGSMERLMGVLIENFAGKWPFWLSPRQVMVVPVTGVVYDYAQSVQKKLYAAGFYADVDLGSETLNKKIRNAELSLYNFICVVGAEEMAEGSVNVRCRDDVGTKAKGQTVPLDKFVTQLNELVASRSLESKLSS